MAAIDTIANGSFINIRLITERLGGDFTNCKKLGFVTYTIAVRDDANLKSQHANIYSDLPEGTPRNAEDLEYLLVELPDGKTVRALARPWFDNDVTIIENVVADVSLKLVNIGELERLRKTLISSGFDIITMGTK